MQTKIDVGAWTEFPPAPADRGRFPETIPAGTEVAHWVNLPNDNQGNRWFVVVAHREDGATLYAPVADGMVTD